MTFQIKAEWHEAPGVTDAALAATWARTSITVGPRPLELYDERRQAVRDGFFGSVLPLVEWLIDSWGRLIHERARPAANSMEHREWSGYHSFQAGREGGAMPNISLRRIDGDWFQVHAAADERLLPGITVRFFLDAREQVPVRRVEQVLAQLIAATCEQLGRVEPIRADELLARWSSRLHLRSETAGRLGLDEDLLSNSDLAEIDRLAAEPDRTGIMEIAEAIPGRLAERLVIARDIVGRLPHARVAPDQWQELRQTAHSQREHPWLTGWTAAQDFRALLGLTDAHVFATELPSFLEARCGWPVSEQLRPLGAVTGVVRTVFLTSDHALPMVVSTRLDPKSERFRVSKALYYSLFGAAAGLAGTTRIAESPLLPMYSEANAFAAELLAPVAFLRARAPTAGIWERKDVYTVAGALQVSPIVVQHQIENRKIGTIQA